jgi:hypothetical protein
MSIRWICIEEKVLTAVVDFPATASKSYRVEKLRAKKMRPNKPHKKLF